MNKRVLKEINELQKCLDLKTINKIKLELTGDNYFDFKVEIGGPSGTPYENGIFVLNYKYPEGYPFKPPKVMFLTKIWHPNINIETGEICIDILKDAWPPFLYLRMVILSIQSLLPDPEPIDSFDSAAGKQFIKDPELFNRTARYWTVKHAKAPSANDPEFDSKIKRLENLGFNSNQALLCLSSHNWNVDEAIRNLQ